MIIEKSIHALRSYGASEPEIDAYASFTTFEAFQSTQELIRDFSEHREHLLKDQTPIV